MKIKIRKGTKKDYSVIEEIERLVFKHPHTKKEFERRLKNNPRPYYIVATFERKVIGYSIGYDVKGKLYNAFLAIRPEFQRKGVGTSLIKEIIRIAKRNGFKKTFLKTQNDSIGMISLALKFGFKIIGFKDKEWGDKPAVWLEKKI